jgi:glutathione peroxidase
VTNLVPPPIYNLSAPLLSGKLFYFEQLRGKVLLIANTASRCGFTGQYAELEGLYRRFAPDGLVVLGFPCNQFGAQEPGSSTEIGAFCEKNFGVTFPVFERIEVNGPHTHPLFAFLKQQKPGLLALFTRGRIAWNFTKFLVDRSGQVVGRFAPSTRPDQLLPQIEALLQAKQATQ